MKNKFLLVVSLLLLAAASPSQAARDASNVRIVELTIGSTTGNTVFIRASADPVGSSCHNNNYWHFTLSLETAQGKNMYALLLSAAAAGQSLGLSGLGVCNEWNGVESLRAVGVIY